MNNFHRNVKGAILLLFTSFTTLTSIFFIVIPILWKIYLDFLSDPTSDYIAFQEYIELTKYLAGFLADGTILGWLSTFSFGEFVVPRLIPLGFLYINYLLIKVCSIRFLKKIVHVGNNDEYSETINQTLYLFSLFYILTTPLILIDIILLAVSIALLYYSLSYFKGVF